MDWRRLLFYAAVILASCAALAVIAATGGKFG